MKNKFSYIQNEFADLLSICDIRHVLHAWLRMRFCRDYPQRVGCVCLLGSLFVLFSQTLWTKTISSGAGAPVVTRARDFASLRPRAAPPHVLRRLRRHRKHRHCGYLHVFLPLFCLFFFFDTFRQTRRSRSESCLRSCRVRALRKLTGGCWRMVTTLIRREESK